MPAPFDINALLSGYDRRGGGAGGFTGGALSGAGTGGTLGSVLPGVGNVLGAVGGGLVGGIAGLFNKKASTAPTDFTVASASDAITKAIQQANGRAPNPGEVDSILRGQGWKPGDRWVGQGGLTSVLRSINSNAQQAAPPQAAQPKTAPSTTGMAMTDTRRQVMDSLKAGTPNKDALMALLQGR